MDEAVAVEMTVGEAFLFVGSTAHAGGANTTSQCRPLHGFFFCRSWMRPEVRDHALSMVLIFWQIPSIAAALPC